MHCYIVGDSLAVGVGGAMPGCGQYAKIGITSEAFLRAMPREIGSDLVVISLGANDYTADTYGRLAAVRERIEARSVIWLIPNVGPHVREAVSQVATTYRDRVIDTRPYIHGSGVHPNGAGYAAIADKVMHP